MIENVGSGGLFAVLAIIFFVGRKVVNHIIYTRARKAKGCEPIARYGNVDPFLGLDLLFTMGKALKNNRFLNWQHEFYAAVGTNIKTFEANLLGSRMVYSSEPENMKAMSTSHWKEFGVEPIRQGNGALSPFTGHGTSTSDGKMWDYSRKLIQPYFDRDGYRNLDRLEVHCEHLLDNIPTDGSTVDMQPLMQRWFLDTSSDFLFGETLGALKNPERSDIAWAMVEVLRGVRLRLQLNRFMFLYRNKKWFDAVARVHKYLDAHIHNALEEQAKGKARSERNDLLWDIAWNIKDPIAIRSQLIAVFIPSNDTTSIFISNIFYVLARHPEVWNKLRKEVEDLGSEPLTFERIRGLRYMNWVQNETHRLYPNSVQMVRVALSDTTLPVGGGPDQKSPIFVQKGDVAHCNRYLMHRDPDIWGADAEVFRPERWEDIRPMWKFVPFGGGPRICPAHVLVATEASFVLVKFLERFKAIKAVDDKPYNAVMRIGPSNIHGVQVAFTPA